MMLRVESACGVWLLVGWDYPPDAVTLVVGARVSPLIYTLAAL
jgi:hypothetical protein